jgi:hypothetical protein
VFRRRINRHVPGDSPESTRQTTAAVILGTVPDQERICARGRTGTCAGTRKAKVIRKKEKVEPPLFPLLLPDAIIRIICCSCRLCAKRSPCAVLGMPWLSLFGKLRGDIAIVLKADRQSPTRATDTQMGGCDHMRVCCQAQTCQYVIKCAERAGAGLRAPVAFVSGIGTMAQAPHRFQTWCLPRTFGLISSVNGRKVRFDRFGASALCWFFWNGHSIAARRP